MKKDVVYRIVRIITVILFLFVASYFRGVTEESYNLAGDIEKNLGANLSVVQLSEKSNKMEGFPVSDEVGSSREGYVFKVTNNFSSDKKFTFAMINDVVYEDERLPYENVRYQILKNGKVIVTDNIDNNGYLYSEVLNAKEEAVYEIKFWIDKDAGNEIMGKRFSSKIALI